MRFHFFFLINIKWTLFLLRELISCFFKNYLAFFILVFPLNGQNVRLSVIKALRGTSLSREIRKVFSTRLHFMSNWYFPKSCEIERLDMRLWEKLKKLWDSQENHESWQVCIYFFRLRVSMVGGVVHSHAWRNFPF